MTYNRSIFRLYAVAGRSPEGNNREGEERLVWQIEQAMSAGVTLIQLREKNLKEDDFLKEAVLVRSLTRRRGIPLIINDNVDVAIQCGADGVHIGQTDLPARQVRTLLGPEKILGVTAKTEKQARQAYLDGADYLGAGALFQSPTKKDAVPMTVTMLSAICQAVPIPVVAIGGITENNISFLKDTGIAGAAAAAGIFGQSSIPAAVTALNNKLAEVIL